jgi:hypothetical protein
MLLVATEEDIIFEQANLDPRFVYLRNGKELKNEDVLPKGNNWISFRGTLLGGKSGVNFRML